MSVPETGTLQNQMGEHWHIDLLANIDILSLKSVQILTHILQHCVHGDNCKCTSGWKKSQTDACKHWHGEGGDELWVKGEITTRPKGTKIYIVEKNTYVLNFARPGLGTSCKRGPVNSGQWDYYVRGPRIPSHCRFKVKQIQVSFQVRNLGIPTYSIKKAYNCRKSW